MAGLRRRERQLTTGEFRIRVWTGIFVGFLVLVTIVAMING